MATKSINKYNVAVTQQSGKVGTVRYYQRGGNTYVRAAHNASTSINCLLYFEKTPSTV